MQLRARHHGTPAVESHFPLAVLQTCYRNFLPLDDIECYPSLLDLYRLWKSREPEIGFPTLSDIDPLALLPETVSYMTVLDVHRDPMRFFYRLMGTGAEILQNRNLKDTYVHQIHPKALRDILLQDLTVLAEDGQPQMAELSFTNATGNRRNVTVLRLPLAAERGPAAIVSRIAIVCEPLS